MSGSLALKAGAWHSFSDIFVSSLVLAGLLLARREDVTLSNGISRIENIIACVVGIFILYIGYDIFMEVIKGEPTILTNVPFVIGGAGVTIAISYFMARYKIFVGKETNSPSLVADGFHSKLDMYSSIIVVVGLVGYQMGLTAMDRLTAVVVVVLVVWGGLEIIFGALSALRSGGMPERIHDNHLLQFLTMVGPKFIKGGIAFLLVLYLLSGSYVVSWNQVGIKKRFGKPVPTAIQPGFHLRLPWPFSTVDLIDVENVQKARTQQSLMLTGDENLIEVEATALYNVQDPFRYTYDIADPQKLVAMTVESAVRRVISGLPVDTILTDGKSEIQNRTLLGAQKVLDEIGAGVRLNTVQLTRAAPPADVLPSFRDVASAKEDQETYLNEAYAYRNQIIPESRGTSAGIIADAEAYLSEKIAGSRGEAGAFRQQLDAFNENEDITRSRLYIETMERVLAGTEKVIVDKRVGFSSTDLWMFGEQLDKAPVQIGERQ
jgi:membrane protease subunit HflK